MVPLMFEKNQIKDSIKKGISWKYSTTLIKLMPRKVAFTLLLMVLISLTEGISLLLLVPLLQLVGLNVEQGSIGQIASIISSIFAMLKFQPTLVSVLAIYVIIICFGAYLNRLQTIKASDIEFEFASYLRKSLYNAITNSKWLFLSKMKYSNLAHALTNEIERISIGTSQYLSLLASVMILIVYVLFALKLAGFLAGIIFVIGVFMLLSLRRKTIKSQSSGEEITTTTRELYSLVMQMLEGMKTIKSFNVNDKNVKIFSNQTNKVTTNYIDTVKSYADAKFLFDVGTVIILSIMVIVLLEVIKLPTASLLLLIYLFVRMIPQFSSLQHSYQYYITMLPAFSNVMNLKKICIENKEDKETVEDEIEFKTSIDLEDVTFAYDTKDMFKIKDLDLKIRYGCTTAIVGSSGSGKSTIADLVMGLIQPDNGKIKVDNVSITEDFTNKIGYVAQETFLFNETVRNNLILAMPNAKDEEIWDVLKRAQADKFVSKLPESLDTVVGDRGIRLSGGERQRLALARALLSKPVLLILDEATSNIDYENEKKILDAIHDLHGEMTILTIAHRLSTIKNADYIYLIENGIVIESGTWNELLKNNGELFKAI